MNLIDEPKFVRLVFGVHREPGAYALLLGSGVSRGAGIPSGWDVTLKLVEELARIRAPETPDSLEWYKSQYGEEPRYDKVLELVGKGSADRQAIVRPYFEPTQTEKDNGIKVPGVAHKSIARLVKQGYIRVILTTNFDRLLEGALSDVGVMPNVVNGAEGIDGARSYASEPCTIVKINGDYQDTRIRNSVPELSEYPANLDTYLGAILDAYGLVVCGWSATYDEALTGLLIDHPNLRYGTYWLAREDLGREAVSVANSRKADVISIANADQAFQTLADTIQSQDAGTRADPFTVDQITNSVRACVGDTAREAQLTDILQEESRRMAETTPSLLPDIANTTKETVQTAIDQIAAAIEPLVSAAAYVSHYGSADQTRWTLNAFGRVAQQGLYGFDKNPTRGLVLLPGVLIVFGSLVGALLADKPDTAARLLLSTILWSDKGPVHWPTRINELVAFYQLMEMKLISGGQIGAGNIILKILGKMHHIQSMAISQANFDATYEVAEYAIGLVAQAYIENERFHQWDVPSGVILKRWSIWGGGGDKESVEPLDMAFQNSGLKSALLASGFVGCSASTFDATEKQYRDTLAKYGRSQGL